MMQRFVSISALAIAAGLAIGFAQEQPRTLIVEKGIQVGGVAGAPGLPPPNVFYQTFDFVKGEMAFDSKVVKGAPYSADAVTESVQTLADGNHIRHTTKATLYRDSMGRTRREQSLGEIGPLLSSGEPVRSIVINDPVAATTIMLDTRAKTAHQMPGGKMMAERRLAEAKARVRAAGDGQPVETTQTFTENGRTIVLRNAARITAERVKRDVQNENLGVQTIEGVPCDGTRETLTIPAGAVGNELPIKVVTETWYSPQLQMTVMTKTFDPRMGETTYKLTNIRQEEPSAALFQVPPDYTTAQ